MESIIQKIDAYCAKHGISHWQFSKKFFGTVNVYDRIKSGNCHMRTIRRVEKIVSQPDSAKPKKRQARRK